MTVIGEEDQINTPTCSPGAFIQHYYYKIFGAEGPLLTPPPRPKLQRKRNKGGYKKRKELKRKKNNNCLLALSRLTRQNISNLHFFGVLFNLFLAPLKT